MVSSRLPAHALIAVLTASSVGFAQRGGTFSDRSAAATTVNAVTTTIALGGGRAVRGAQGVALNASTGLVYVGLNGTIVRGCSGQGTANSGPGANQMSIIDLSQLREIGAVATGGAPIWPTVDPDRHVVYMANSGSGTITRHDETTGALLGTITVGGMPHQGGLDYSTRLMLVTNTVQVSEAIAGQNHASVVNTASDAVVREFEIGPGAHAVAVDQDRDLAYATSVGNGAVTVVNLATGLTEASAIPKSIYGAEDGNNNMIARQAATRRLFQVNGQRNAIGILVINEVTLALERLIQFGSFGPPWGLWVDEPNRLLFAAFPGSNAVGVVDLDTLTHVATVPVGTCPYSVAIDPGRRLGVAVNQGSPTEYSTASLFDLCPVYLAVGRRLTGCTDARLSLDSPANGSQPGLSFTIAGWAADVGAGTGTGVDVIHTYAYPISNGTLGSPMFVGQAAYGSARSDVGAVLGSQFTNCGFTLSASLAAGTYRLIDYAHSTLTGTFNSYGSTDITVTAPPSTPSMALDNPAHGSTLSPSFVLVGWAVDRGAPAGTGVDALHVYAYPLVNGVLGAPAFLGPANYGAVRSDVGAVFGNQFTNSGFSLAATLSPGSYRLVASAHSTVTSSFVTSTSADVTVTAATPNPVMAIDGPANNATVTLPVIARGWAVDLGAASGSGVDAIHVWAFPVINGVVDGAHGVFVNQGTPGARPDVGAVFGSQFTNSGYTVVINGLTPGQHDLGVYARSTVSGTFNQVKFARITVQ